MLICGVLDFAATSRNCCICEGHCCWICHWPGMFILCSCVWEWDENGPEPRSFVHVACSCTYMFVISVRDVAALLNAAVHKFSAGVCSSQNLRVLHVFLSENWMPLCIVWKWMQHVSVYLSECHCAFLWFCLVYW